MHGAPCFPDPRHDEATRNEIWSDLSLFESVGGDVGLISPTPFTRPSRARLVSSGRVGTRLFFVSGVSIRNLWPSLDVTICCPLQEVDGSRMRIAISKKQKVLILLESSSELTWETTD